MHKGKNKGRKVYEEMQAEILAGVGNSTEAPLTIFKAGRYSEIVVGGGWKPRRVEGVGFPVP